jgi:hypothetical protein
MSSSDTTVARGRHPNSRSNLRPFTVGNQPKRRGKRAPVSLKAILRRRLKETCSADKELRVWAEVIVERTMLLAAKGNAVALREVWDRIDGKAKDQVEHSGKVETTPAPVVFLSGIQEAPPRDLPDTTDGAAGE